jgi:hypothetical protein
LLEVLEALVAKPLLISGVTPAALFRVIERYAPTVLVDEWDSTGEEMQEALRQVLNSGFRRTGRVLRCVGDDHEPVCFWTFAPKAVAGIGEVADTVASRSIRVALTRRLSGEAIARFVGFDGTELARKCARWAKDHAEQLRAARPDVPSELSDRQAEAWAPLLAIADLCGAWGELARQAALLLCGQPAGESITVALLADIRQVFDRPEPADRLRTEQLLSALNGMADRPWATFCHGAPLHAHKLSQLLGRYDIGPTTIAIGAARAKGYFRGAFEEAFARFLPPSPIPVSPI